MAGYAAGQLAGLKCSMQDRLRPCRRQVRPRHVSHGGYADVRSIERPWPACRGSRVRWRSRRSWSHDDGPAHRTFQPSSPCSTRRRCSFTPVGGISTDITQRKRAEESLKFSERRFRTLCHGSPVGIFLTDPQGRCTYTNPRLPGRSYGFDFAESTGRGMVEVHPPRVIALNWSLEQWSRDAAIGVEFSMEYRTLRSDGAVRWVHDRTGGPVLGLAQRCDRARGDR